MSELRSELARFAGQMETALLKQRAANLEKLAGRERPIVGNSMPISA